MKTFCGFIPLGISKLNPVVRITDLKTNSKILILFLLVVQLMMVPLTPTGTEVRCQSGNDSEYPEIWNLIISNTEDGLLPSQPEIKKCKYLQLNQLPRFENVFSSRGNDTSNFRDYLPRHPQFHYPFIVFKISFSQFTAES